MTHKNIFYNRKVLKKSFITLTMEEIFKKRGIEVLEDIVGKQAIYTVYVEKEFRKRHAKGALNKILDRTITYSPDEVENFVLRITGPGAQEFERIRKDYWEHLRYKGDLGSIFYGTGEHEHIVFDLGLPFFAGQMLGGAALVTGLLMYNPALVVGGIGAMAAGAGLDLQQKFRRVDRFEASRCVCVMTDDKITSEPDTDHLLRRRIKPIIKRILKL